MDRRQGRQLGLVHTWQAGCGARTRLGESRRAGLPAAAFSLVELLIILAMLAILAAMLVPSLGRAKEHARLAVCSTDLRNIAVGLKQYAASHDHRLPPFAFSDQVGNLPLSGHWGGQSQPADPDCFGRRNVENINLWPLVAGRYTDKAALLCPSAGAGVGAGRAGYFPYTTKFSTYCLRLPYSPDLFRAAPLLSTFDHQRLLSVYAMAGGGFAFHVGMEKQTVPVVRTDFTYTETVDGQQRQFDPSAGAILADQFWRQQSAAPAPQHPPAAGYPAEAAWCHGDRFNVLYGDGGVSAVRDLGTVAANTVAPAASLPDDGQNSATYAVRVWRYFEDKR